MTGTIDAIAREMRELADTPYSAQTCHSNTLKRWASRLTALSNQGEGAETEESIAADCYFHIGEMVGTLRGGSVTEHVQTILEVLGECSEYMHNIPESDVGGSDEAVRIAKNLRDCLSGTIADVELHPAEADSRDADMLDFMRQRRLGVYPELEGAWHAELYDDNGDVKAAWTADDPRDVIYCAMTYPKDAATQEQT